MRRHNDKQYKYSIRKMKKGGAGSFIIGAVFLGSFLLNGPEVSAVEATETVPEEQATPESQTGDPRPENELANAGLGAENIPAAEAAIEPEQGQENPSDVEASQEEPSQEVSTDAQVTSENTESQETEEASTPVEPAKGHEGEKLGFDRDLKPVIMDTPKSQEEAETQISDPAFEKEYTFTINYVAEVRQDEAGTTAKIPVYPPNPIEVKKSELDGGPISIESPQIQGYKTDQAKVELTREFLEENNGESRDVLYKANEYTYEVKHLLQSFNKETGEWDAWQEHSVTQHKGHVGETVTADPIKIEGYYPEEDLLETTLPDTLREDGQTLDVDLNVRYYRNFYHVYYNTQGGTDIRTKKAIHGQAVPGVEDPERRGYTFLGWTRDVRLAEDQVAASLLDTAAISEMPKSDVTFTAHWKENEETSYMINVWAQKSDLVDPDNPGSLANYDFIGRVKRDKDLETGQAPKTDSLILNPALSDLEIADLEFPDTQNVDSSAANLSKYFVRNDALTAESNSQKVPIYEGATETQPRGQLKADESSVLNVIYDRAVYEIYFLKPVEARNSRLINGIYHMNGQTYQYDPNVPGSAYMAEVRFGENMMPYWPNSAEEVVLEDGTVTTELAGFRRRQQFQGFDFRTTDSNNAFYTNSLNYVDNPPYRLDPRFIENAENTRDTLYGQPLEANQRILTPIESTGSNVHPIHTLIWLESIEHANGKRTPGTIEYELSPLTNTRVDTKSSSYQFKAPLLRGFTANSDQTRQNPIHGAKFDEFLDGRAARRSYTTATYENLRDDIYFRDYLPGQPAISLSQNGYLEFRYKRNNYDVQFFNSGETLIPSASIARAYETDLATLDLDQLMFDQIQGDANNIPSQYELFGQTIVRPAHVPEDYVFKGWTMDAAGDQPLVQRDETGKVIARPLPAQTTPLYATWGPHQFPHDIHVDYGFEIHPVSPDEAALLDERNPNYEAGDEVSRYGLIQRPHLEKLSEAALGLELNDRVEVDEQGRVIPPGTPDSQLANIKRTGYVFTGWDIVVEETLPDGSKQVHETPYAFDNEVVSDIHLKANWVRDDRVTATINHVFHDHDSKVVNTIIEYDHDLRPGAYYAAYATKRGDSYIPDKNYDGFIVSPDGENTVTFNYYPYPERNYEITYRPETGDIFGTEMVTGSPHRDYDVAQYKPIAGYQAQTVQNQLKFFEQEPKKATVNGQTLDLYETSFVYKDVRAIERIPNEVTAETPIPKGYVRIVFDTDGNGTLNTTSQDKIIYDVLEGVPARALTMPSPLPKVGYTFKEWQEALPTGDTPLAAATYTAIFEEIVITTGPTSQNVLENSDITPIVTSLDNVPEGSNLKVTFDGEDSYPGLTVDSETGLVTGSPQITWGPEEEIRKIPVQVALLDADGDPVLDKDNNPIVKNMTIDVYRDTDKDGLPDFDTGMPLDPNNPIVGELSGDLDDDNDGISDQDDKKPKIWNALTATLEESLTQNENVQVEENTPAVTVNKPNAKITSTPTKGLSIDENGNLVGTPSVTDWKPGEKSRQVLIPVTVISEGTGSNGENETITLEVPVTINRVDTEAPVLNVDAKGIETPEGQAITPIDVRVSDNVNLDIVPEVSGLPTGLEYDPEMKQIKGTVPVGTVNWGDDNHESEKFSVTITATDEAGLKTTETIIVTVLRDTDGDGTPDIRDNDDDDDGIPDDQDESPKAWDALTATPETYAAQREGQVVPEGTPAVKVNKPNTVITSDSVNGLSVNPEGNLVGTPAINDWRPEEEERIVQIPVKVVSKGTAQDGTDEEKTVIVSVSVQRDTDGDGIPDVTDTDDDGDGIPDDQDESPKAWNALAATPETFAAQREGQVVPEGTPAVSVNKPNTVITSDEVNGLSVDPAGNLVGTPAINNWELEEEERIVQIPVKVVSKGTAQDGTDEEITVTVSIPVQRDTDGDGIPDVTDTDDDGDGILDDQDESPKVWDALAATPETFVAQREGQAIPEGTPAVVQVNKPNTVITSDPINGLSVDPAGNLVGTPAIYDWGPEEEERIVQIPVKVVSKETAQDGTDEEITVTVSVPVQRDTDGDGTPDVTDTDDDGDGIPDDEDQNPKIWDALIATPDTFTAQREGEAIPDGTPAVQVNKLNTTITSEPVNGLGVDPAGNLVGTPLIDDWAEAEEERIIQIPVKVVSKGTAQDGTDEEKTVIVSVPVQRDTDGDGTPDVTDTDDDGDGIPDDEDQNPKVWDALIATPNTFTAQREGEAIPDGTPAVRVNKPNPIITSDPINGLSVDPGGNLVGTPKIEDWRPEEEVRTVEIPVTVSSKGTAEDGSDEEKTVIVSFPVQRDTDGDGIPDVTDTDDDGDGISDDQDENPKVWDALIATPLSTPNQTENVPLAPNTTGVTVNKPNAKITSTPTNGLSIDENGNLTGTPTVTDWAAGEKSRQVLIPVTVTSEATGPNGENETITLEVPVTINRVDTVAPVLNVDAKGIETPEGQAITPIYVSVTDNVSLDILPEITGLPDGLAYDPETKQIKGTVEPGTVNWTDDSKESVDYPVTITVTDEAGLETTETITITVLRDTDGDGIPDTTDKDDDGDGILDDQDESPKVWDALVAKPLTIPIQTENVPLAPNTTGVTVNKPNTKITSIPTNGLSIDENGNLAGTPTVTDWAPGEKSRQVLIPVTVTSEATGPNGENETMTLEVPVMINRVDTEAPVLNVDAKGIETPEGQAITPIAISVSDNVNLDIVLEVKGLPTGLAYDSETNQIKGTVQEGTVNWGDDNHESEEFPVTITVTDEAGLETTETITVTVLRDTDGDGTPDIRDKDDDGDGIPDDQDENPKVWDALAATPETFVAQREGQAIPKGTPAVRANKPNPIITSDPINGLSVDPAGNLVGTPVIGDWAEAEEERIVQIPVKIVSKGTAQDGTDEEITVIVSVSVQRDTDGDGIPDVNDSDDDGDGILDDQDESPKVWDALVAKPLTIPIQTENVPLPPNTTGVTVNKPNAKITSIPTNGLGIDENGNLTGSPSVTDWALGEKVRQVLIPVTITSEGTGPNGENEIITLEVPVTINRVDTEAPVLNVDAKDIKTPEGQEITPIAISVSDNVNLDIVPVVKGLPTGLSYDSETNQIKGTVQEGTVNWGYDNHESEEFPVTITVTDEAGLETTETITVTVLRDTDGDGTPDIRDNDDDGDGIPDNQDENPKVWDALAATPETFAAHREGEAIPDGTPAVRVNKPNPIITSNPVNGLSVDPAGNLVGTPAINDWGPEEEERIVHIPVKVVSKGTAQDETDEEITVTVSVPVQRDTDGDGIPDVTDTDDDGDGIPDDQDESPKVWDALIATPLTIPIQTENVPLLANIPGITVNKPNAKISSTPTNGLLIDEKGNLIGSPKVTDWASNEKIREVLIPVTVTSEGTGPNGENETEKVLVTVQVKRLENDYYEPNYQAGKGAPGSVVNIDKPEIRDSSGNVVTLPEGSSIKPEGHAQGVLVNEDGSITVEIPKEAKAGDIIEVPVIIEYPDGTIDKALVTVTVEVSKAIDTEEPELPVQPEVPVEPELKADKELYDPIYQEGKGLPASQVTIAKPIFKDLEGKIVSSMNGLSYQVGDKTPGVRVNEDGSITVDIPKDAKAGDRLEIPILVEYPDGSIDRPIVIVIVEEGEKAIEKTVDKPEVCETEPTTAEETVQAPTVADPEYKAKGQAEESPSDLTTSAGAENTGQTLPKTGLNATSLTGLAAVLLGLGLITGRKKKTDKDED